VPRTAESQTKEFLALVCGFTNKVNCSTMQFSEAIAQCFLMCHYEQRKKLYIRFETIRNAKSPKRHGSNVIMKQ
jgi:hypothetical protein